MTTPLQSAQSLLKAEAEALTELSQRLDGSFTKVVDLIAKHSGKVVLIGVGKSGLIAQKIAATLCSTGTPAIFLHAADATLNKLLKGKSSRAVGRAKNKDGNIEATTKVDITNEIVRIFKKEMADKSDL